MPLDPRVQRFLRVLAAANPSDARNMSVAARRESVVSLMSLGRMQVPIPFIEERSVPGADGELAMRVYSPVQDKTLLPGLIYFHGGGLVAGSIDTHDVIARSLAASAGCRVLSVDYRLAPEHPFPCALEDSFSAVEHILENAAAFHLDSLKLGIAGDSAGATLAAATVQRVARSRGPVIALQLLLCPILDYSRLSPSRREFASGYLVGEDTLDHDLMHYLPQGVQASDPRVSPLLAEQVAGLPTTFIHTAEYDPLRDEGRNYFERLTREGVEVSYTCHPGMIHLFYGLGAVIPYARTAFDQIGAQVRGAWSRNG